jgi:HAD superfamily hydrolase (TIGR01509 family)
MKYKAILFDVDGVLIESERTRFNFLQKSCQEKGINLPDESFYQIIGKSTSAVVQEIFQHHPSDNRAKEILDEYVVFKRDFLQNITPIATTVDFIRQYSGGSKMGIATMNSREATLNLLSYLKIDAIIRGVITRDDVVNQKPNPEAYSKLSQSLNIHPHECVVIEDTVVGVQSGINAGMDCYILLNSYNSREQFSGLNIAGYITSQKDLEEICL